MRAHPSHLEATIRRRRKVLIFPPPPFRFCLDIEARERNRAGDFALAASACHSVQQNQL